MATAETVAPDLDEPISPRQPAPAPNLEQSIQSVVSHLSTLDRGADPDAQATVTDFLDFTEYLPADITRSLNLITELDQRYIEASTKVHELTKLWGRLPSIPPAERPDPVHLRKEISEYMRYAMDARASSLAEARRMADNVKRHHVRAKIILKKLENMYENYHILEEQQQQINKSPQATRTQKQKARRPRVPRITVPGEVLAPYELDYNGYSTDSESSSEEEKEVGQAQPSNKLTPAPQARIKVVKGSTARAPKPARAPRSRISGPLPNAPSGSGTQLSTSAAMAQLKPPPENAEIGGPDAPWGQLTPYELARLRKRMKKNASWTPSDTMVARELSSLGRGVEAYKAAKLKAEQEGRPFEGKLPQPVIDPETGEKRMPPGALTLEALTREENSLSNRGMKLNEAKKLKREMLAKMAAEEAEESARRFDAIARTLMSSDATSAAVPVVQEQPKPATGRKTQRKRKRDAAALEAEADKGEATDGQAQRPQLKRTKTETPVPPPVITPSGAQLPSVETSMSIPRRTSTAGVLQSTSPIPIPIPAQAAEQTITAKPAVPAVSSVSPASTGPASAAPSVRLPTSETPIPPPVISPKKSTTPILPPVRETRKTQAARLQEQQQLQAGAAAAAASAPMSAAQRMTSLSGSPEASAVLNTEPESATAAVTTTTTTTTTILTTSSTTAMTTKRPTSRGKGAAAEPQPTAASERPRRSSTARNTPAPEVAGTSGGTGATSATAATESAGAATRQASKRSKRPAPGVISRTNSGGSSAVGTRKAAPRKKSTSTRGGSRRGATAAAAVAAAENATGEAYEVEVDDEGNVIDPDEPRYCVCNRVSFGTMIQCDNVEVSRFSTLQISEYNVMADVVQTELQTGVVPSRMRWAVRYPGSHN